MAKRYSPTEKVAIILEVLRGETTLADACRRYGISQTIFYRWKEKFLKGAKDVSPNEKLFFYAVAQTHPEEYKRVKEMGWKKVLREKLLKVRFIRIREDAEPFLENIGEASLLTRETFMEILE